MTGSTRADAARRWFPPVTLAAAVAAVAHGAVTWSPAGAAAYAVGVGLGAFLAEAAVVRLGLLVHHTGPRVAGVPVGAVAGWIAATYAAIRLVGTLAGPTPAFPGIVGLVATVADALVERRCVAAGLWDYPETPFSRPRIRGIPWWNAVGWFLLAAGAALLATTDGVAFGVG